MSARKTQRQLADEAFHRLEQLRIDDQPPAPAKEYPQLEGLPTGCPECKRIWNEVNGLNPLAVEEGAFLAKSQCAGCASIFLIPVDAHARILTARAAERAVIAARREAAKPKKKERRTRGAG